MKKIFKLLILLVLVATITLNGCTQPTNQQTNGNTQITYIVPIWKGSLAKAPENPEIGWAYYNTTDGKSYIYDGSSWQIFAQDGTTGSNGTNNTSPTTGDAIGYVYLGETTEDVDGVIYTVKTYADVYTQEGYFYTYYKFYYLNEILHRTYTFYHNIGCELDYRYDEFAEHICCAASNAIIVHYYDSGKLASSTSKSIGQTIAYGYYENDRAKYTYVEQYGKVTSFSYNYPSGYLQYLYSSGKLYTFDDNIATSTSFNNEYKDVKDCSETEIKEFCKNLIR